MPKPPKVEIGKTEMVEAANIGAYRQIAAVMDGKVDQHGADPENGWGYHIQGAIGERVVAKYLGVYYTGTINTYRVGGDVGKLQVRTRSRNSYELVIRKNDRDDDAFVLVTGYGLVYNVVGWAWGRDGKREEWWKSYANRPPAYYVPHSALQPPETIPIDLAR